MHVAPAKHSRNRCAYEVLQIKVGAVYWSQKQSMNSSVFNIEREWGKMKLQII